MLLICTEVNESLIGAIIRPANNVASQEIGRIIFPWDGNSWGPLLKLSQYSTCNTLPQKGYLTPAFCLGGGGGGGGGASTHTTQPNPSSFLLSP
jgi:hypothetical protein